MEDVYDEIIEALSQKACVKQAIFRKTIEVFGQMRKISEALAEKLSSDFQKIDENVIIEHKNINEFEFQLKFSGDMLTFTMHTNVTTFPDEHILSKSPYILENESRGFYGSIMIYNFMADSLKYNRLNDLGYLIARMVLNLEGHFYIEGVRQLNFLHPDISQNQINEDILISLIEQSMLTAIDQDLLAPSYQDIQVVPLGVKLANQMVWGGEKVGFQMIHQKK